MTIKKPSRGPKRQILFTAARSGVGAAFALPFCHGWPFCKGRAFILIQALN